MSLEGTQLGNYRLIRQIGSGGMGEIYLAEDTRIARQVAVKVVRNEPASYPDAAATQESARLFQREMKAVASLDNPHTLPLYDFGEQTINGTTITYMVMPYRAEGSLNDWMSQRTEKLSFAEINSIIQQAADALQNAHDNGIIHQDVKPSNFLIRSRRNQPNQPDLLLADFGIAKILGATSTASQTSRGTATFMPPEQWDGQPVAATDQYALAIMAYMLLTGRPPFQGRLEQVMRQHFMTELAPPSTLNPAINADVDKVILHALAKKPEERFASISNFANALQQALLHSKETTPLPQTLEPTVYASSGPLAQEAPVLAPTVPSASEPVTPQTAANTLEPTIFASNTTPTISSSRDQIASEAIVKTKRPKGKKPLIISLVVIVLVLGVVGGVYYGKVTPNRAIATDEINNTIAQTNAKNIAQIDSTLINTNFDPYLPAGGKLTLYDPMSDNSNQGFGWEVGNGCNFVGGVYQVNLLTLCDAQNIELNNFAFEIAVDFTESYGEAGIFFREASDVGHGFLIENDGTYYIQAHARNLFGDLLYPISIHGNSDAIHKGVQTNIFAVVAIGSTIALYVNGTKVDGFNDSLSNYGSIELGNFGDGPDNFHDAKLWTF